MCLHHGGLPGSKATQALHLRVCSSETGSVSVRNTQCCGGGEEARWIELPFKSKAWIPLGLAGGRLHTFPRELWDVGCH